MFDFPVILKAQPEGGFVVHFPDVPEAITQGEDEEEEEALLYAVDALETALSFSTSIPVCLCRSRPRRSAGRKLCALRRWNARSSASTTQ